MFENRIKELRRAKGLTQHQLAEAAETSQQQIQRIEAGHQLARFDLATRISAALGHPIGKVFPSAELPLARMRRRAAALDDEKASKELEAAGLDMEPEVWTVKYRLRGGAEGTFRIAGPDVSRLNSILQDDAEDGFVVLPSFDRQYALNVKHLVFCQLLFDRPSIEVEAPPEKSFEVLFHLVDQREPLRFDVDPDTNLLEREEDPDPLSVQLQDLFYYAEMGEHRRRLSFVDLDGERAFFRSDDVSMFSVPLWLIEPNVSDEDDETESDQND
ncbi:helix-turn-helix transcriptional regulator [Bradyrhizobium sp. BWC-3-1]|uniref:helix-turn-helix transcriptional regulator n=1 Tax=Bradyrhizobium sp. BWC-3-1 TaxID=3080012 RepID=UPI00293E1446|nr:helix-turn-helix transcriptional regulator [Bradyrhizobium sp. BWC-3-1]WOH59771.1 helix-turn-helix transcriptional regulator [Bradyrhizobium sp. BWC-3-1]